MWPMPCEMTAPLLVGAIDKIKEGKEENMYPVQYDPRGSLSRGLGVSSRTIIKDPVEQKLIFL
jgi:hypothetical protein